MSCHKRALLSPGSAALRRLDDLAAQLRAGQQRPTGYTIPIRSVTENRRDLVIDVTPQDTTAKVLSEIKSIVEKNTQSIADIQRGMVKMQEDITYILETLAKKNIEVIEPEMEYDDLLNNQEDLAFIAVGDRYLNNVKS